MDNTNLNRRQTIRVGPGVAYAQVGVVGFDGPIDLQALRLYGLPEATPAVLNGTPLLSGPLRLGAARVRGGGLVGPAEPRGGCDGAARRDRHGGAGWRPSAGLARTIPSGCWRATCRTPPSTSRRRRCRCR
jgi:hypothetical protein